MGRTRPSSAPPVRQLEHGSSRPPPEPSSFSSGAGVFRTFAQNSKYLSADPLRYKSPKSQESFALGPPSKKSPGSCFRTLDISKVNETRYKWNRLDTFQTPFGHLAGDIEQTPGAPYEAPPPTLPKAAGFQTKLLQALEADLFEEFHSSLESFASEVVGGLSQQLQAFRQDLVASLELLRADAEGGKFAVGAGGIAASSHEAHCAGGDNSGADVDVSKIMEEVRAGTLSVLESLKQIQMETTDRSADADQWPILFEQITALIAQSGNSEQQLTALIAQSGNSEQQLTALRAQSGNSEQQLTALRAQSEESMEQICALRDQSAASEVDVSRQESMSSLLEAFEEHARSTRSAFRDISQTVLGEVRKGWVEVGAIWGNKPSDVCAPADTKDVDVSKVLQAFEEHAQSSRALHELVLEDVHELVLDKERKKVPEVHASSPQTVGGVDGLLTCGQLQEQMAKLEERLFSRISSNDKAAMPAMQTADSTRTVEATFSFN